MNKPKPNYTGSCLCGAITYRVTKFEPLIGHCHCRMCQKFHGAAFSTFAEVKLVNLCWISGETMLKSYTAANHSTRQFCNCCGSSLTFSSRHNCKAGTIEIAIATLDDSSGLIPDAHIYTRSKVPWINICDSLPEYRQYRE
jgi:hypothetical protein